MPYDARMARSRPDSVEIPETLNASGAQFFRALADPNRLAIVQLLLARPRSVSELVDELGAPQSRISNHLACLRWCRFVSAERRGRQMIYAVSDDRLREVMRLAAEMVQDGGQAAAG